MSDINRIFISGRIGNEIEMKTSGAGKPYLKLSIATHNWSGEKEVTDWHRVVVFGPQAENCSKYLRKGSPVMIEGSLEARAYIDKDGRKSRNVTVIAHHVRFMGGKLGADVETQEGAQEENFAASA